MTRYISDQDIYKYHVSNLKSIELALKHSALAARRAISENNSSSVQSFVRLFALLLGAWLEMRRNKLLYEPSGFTKVDREIVKNSSSQFEQWLSILSLSFRRKYNVSSSILSSNVMPATAFFRYEEVSRIVTDDLRPIIEIRNKLAHGQWVYPLNSEGTFIEQDKFQLINKENLLSLQFKKSIASGITDLIHDLVTSVGTFERDFDLNYKRIIGAKRNLENRSYPFYRDQLIEKRNRGIHIRSMSRSLT